jgi:hypothetical protein
MLTRAVMAFQRSFSMSVERTIDNLEQPSMDFKSSLVESANAGGIHGLSVIRFIQPIWMG